VVAAHAMLQKGQGRERAFLGEAFSRVRALEARRMNTIRTAIEVFLRTYKCGLVHSHICSTYRVSCMQKLAARGRGVYADGLFCFIASFYCWKHTSVRVCTLQSILFALTG
jgi:hypothetical protein